jgi:UDP-N-acetylmuramoyl-tripeptide--D-alanyl-D-alanine ligase
METASPFGRATVTFGMGPANDVRCLNMRNLGRDGFALEVDHRGTLIPIRLRVQGLHNVFNALAAAAIALCLGEPAERIVEGLERFEGVRGRFALCKIPGGGTLVDDTYNSNPTALKMALDSVKALAGGKARILLGLGEMMELGDETLTAHLEAGGMAAAVGASCLVAMGAHAPEMARGALEGGMPREMVSVAESHEAMAARLRREVRSGDLVLLKGSRKMALEKVAACLREERQEEMHDG